MQICCIHCLIIVYDVCSVLDAHNYLPLVVSGPFDVPYQGSYSTRDIIESILTATSTSTTLPSQYKITTGS